MKCGHFQLVAAWDFAGCLLSSRGIPFEPAIWAQEKGAIVLWQTIRQVVTDQIFLRMGSGGTLVPRRPIKSLPNLRTHCACVRPICHQYPFTCAVLQSRWVLPLDISGDTTHCGTSSFSYEFLRAAIKNKTKTVNKKKSSPFPTPFCAYLASECGGIIGS